jgi:hypothetical protein
MGWWWLNLFGGAHVCGGLLSPVAAGQTLEPLTEAEQQDLIRKRCGPRFSVAEKYVFGAGYVVIIAVVGVSAVRAGRPSDESGDDPLVPGG